MVLGISLMLFTKIHVAISLIGIASGFVVALLMLAGKDSPSVTGLFLVMTILTSVTGFFFPFKGVTPGIVLGVLSLIALLLTVMAYYGKHLAGGWRTTYVVTAMLAQFFNCFVLIVQSFQKIPGLHALAPTGTETPFKLSVVTLLIVMVGLTTLAVKKFKPALIA